MFSPSSAFLIGDPIPLGALLVRAKSIRRCLEKAFSEDTSFPGSWNPLCPVSGHCAAVSIIVVAVLGGSLVGSWVDGQDHWFNRIKTTSGDIDLDITGDQFGRPAPCQATSGCLYDGTRVRELSEASCETISRSIVLAQCSGNALFEVMLHRLLVDRL